MVMTDILHEQRKLGKLGLYSKILPNILSTDIIFGIDWISDKKSRLSAYKDTFCSLSSLNTLIVTKLV